MEEKPKKDREPWSPRVDGMPLFTNSADYERSLGEGSGPPNLDIVDEDPKDGEEEVSPAVPDPIIKPA
jgi:hypothetical protein